MARREYKNKAEWDAAKAGLNIDEKADGVLRRIAQSKWTVVWVAAYTVGVFMVGKYTGDLLHWLTR